MIDRSNNKKPWYKVNVQLDNGDKFNDAIRGKHEDDAKKNAFKNWDAKKVKVLGKE